MTNPKPAGLAVRSSAMWCALAYLGGKRGDRDLLKEGSSTAITLEITGKVGRSSVRESIAGSLDIGKQQRTASSTGADADELLALVLKQVGDDHAQAALLERIAQEFASNAGMLPTANAAAVARVQAWRKRLRSAFTITKRGALTFAIATPAADVAA